MLLGQKSVRLHDHLYEALALLGHNVALQVSPDLSDLRYEEVLVDADSEERLAVLIRKQDAE